MSIACSKVTRASPSRIVPSSATALPSTDSSTSPSFDDALGGAAGRHAVDGDSRAAGRQAALAPIGRRQQRRGGEPRVGEAVVAAVLQVGEEVVDDRDRDEEAHVVGARKALERDADDLAVLHHRSAAVAGVDRGVGLDHEVLVGAAVDVAARLDARDDARGRGDVLSAERKAVGVDARAGARQRPEAQRLQALRERGIVDPQHREVAVVARRLDRRDVRASPGRGAAPAPGGRRRSRGRSSGCGRPRSGSRCPRRRRRAPAARAATSRSPRGTPGCRRPRPRRRCRSRAARRSRAPRRAAAGRRGLRSSGRRRRGLARARPVGHAIGNPRAPDAGPGQEQPRHRRDLALDRRASARGGPPRAAASPPASGRRATSRAGRRARALRSFLSSQSRSSHRP